VSSEFTEAIVWHRQPGRIPAADLTVLLSTEHQGVDTGWFDGADWRWAESGGLVGEPVQAWAEMPNGVVPC
jgi:hypothetical protein